MNIDKSIITAMEAAKSAVSLPMDTPEWEVMDVGDVTSPENMVAGWITHRRIHVNSRPVTPQQQEDGVTEADINNEISELFANALVEYGNQVQVGAIQVLQENGHKLPVEVGHAILKDVQKLMQQTSILLEDLLARKQYAHMPMMDDNTSYLVTPLSVISLSRRQAGHMAVTFTGTIAIDCLDYRTKTYIGNTQYIEVV